MRLTIFCILNGDECRKIILAKDFILKPIVHIHYDGMDRLDPHTILSASVSVHPHQAKLLGMSCFKSFSTKPTTLQLHIMNFGCLILDEFPFLLKLNMSMCTCILMER